MVCTLSALSSPTTGPALPTGISKNRRMFLSQVFGLEPTRVRPLYFLVRNVGESKEWLSASSIIISL